MWITFIFEPMATGVKAMILRGKICPYCHRQTEYVDSAYVYEQSFGMIYICKPCDVYVGVYEGTNQAKGGLANAYLRTLRIQTHQHFDALY